MKLESQVVSIDLAKKLKSLNVKQDSLFCWTTNLDLEYLPTEVRNPNIVIAAFTVGELSNLLPSKLEIERNFDVEGVNYKVIYSYHIKISRFYSANDYWFCIYMGHALGEIPGEHSFSENEPKLADAIAKMLIYLLENGLIQNDV